VQIFIEKISSEAYGDDLAGLHEDLFAMFQAATFLWGEVGE
jgi:hypothetical protein